MINRKNIKLYYIPNWMLKKAKRLNLTIADLLNSKKLIDTLSKTDIDKYIADSNSVHHKFNLPLNEGVIRTFFKDDVNLEHVNIHDYMDGISKVSYLDIPYQYNSLSSNMDCFTESYAREYRKSDGKAIKYVMMPELLYVDNQTIVMTIRRVDTNEEYRAVIENSIDTLFSVDHDMQSIVDTPYGRYLISQYTKPSVKLNYYATV